MSPDAPRVATLIASATEIVCALGKEDWLVGRSHECDFPPPVKGLPACTEPKFAVEGSSYEIDQRVKAILQEGLSVYRVFADTLRELQPDVIVTQSQCDVCAVSLRDVENALCEWTGHDAQVVSLEPNALADVWADIQRVADALKISDTGAQLVRELRQRMESIESKTRRLDRKPRVACIEWIEPLMAAGNWMPELVSMAGGENVFGDAGKHSPWMSWGDLTEADPDIVLVLPCGFDISKTREEMPHLTKHAGWENLTAVRNGDVYLLDGNQYFNRPGPRLAESLEILAEILHPDVFALGYEGSCWERVSKRGSAMSTSEGIPHADTTS